jgi:molybdate transport system ATP-binding protein
MFSVAVSMRRGAFVLEAHFESPTPGVVALFGRSGSGKSTLVHLIAGLLDADSGRIMIDDLLLLDTSTDVDISPQRRRIGVVFQEPRLFPHMSVAGNLKYGHKRAAPPFFVTLDAVADLLGIGSLMDRRIQQLSGGERQRVAIGRALLSQPALLLLDEPLASLDASRRGELLPYLESLRDGLAIPMVYVSHDFDEVLRLATHVVLLDRGRTIAQGDITTMSLNPELRAIIGADAVGAVIEGTVLGKDADGWLTRVRVGRGELRIETGAAPAAAAPGSKLRVQLLARDLIVATSAPRDMSVRNVLEGTVHHVAGDSGGSDIITIDIGGALIMARITHAATRELGLAPGRRAWALVKSVSLRGHVSGSSHARPQM